MVEHIERGREDWPWRLWDWLVAPEMGRWFDGIRPSFGAEGRLRIEEERADDTVVIRAESPGISPGRKRAATAGARPRLTVS
jgi:hypothetical protein